MKWKSESGCVFTNRDKRNWFTRFHPYYRKATKFSIFTQKFLSKAALYSVLLQERSNGLQSQLVFIVVS